MRRIFLLTWCAILLGTWATTASQASSPATPAAALRLHADHPLLERIPSPFTSKEAIQTSDVPRYREYTLEGLQPSQFYEVRLSYVGTLPYSFSVTLPALTPPAPGGRKLLDVEKAVFRTDADGRVVGCVGSSSSCLHPLVRIDLVWTGVTDRSDVYAQPIVFAIALETLLPGGLPIGVAKVLVVMLVALAATYLWIAPWIGRLIQRERDQLGLLDSTADEAKSS